MPLPLLLGIGASAIAKSGAGKAIGKKLFGAAAKKGLGGIGKIFGKKAAKKTAAFAASTAAGYGMAAAVSRPKVGTLAPLGLPRSQVGQLATIGGAPGGAAATMPSMGLLPWWRGAQGKFQFPWHDPSVPQFLQQFALDDAYLKVSYRAPRGYVVVRDPQGRPYCVLKAAAKAFGLWRPADKPPISVGDWNAFKSAARVEKKLRKIAGPALRKHSRGTACKTRKKGR